MAQNGVCAGECSSGSPACDTPMWLTGQLTPPDLRSHSRLCFHGLRWRFHLFCRLMTWLVFTCYSSARQRFLMLISLAHTNMANELSEGRFSLFLSAIVGPLSWFWLIFWLFLPHWMSKIKRVHWLKHILAPKHVCSLCDLLYFCLLFSVRDTKTRTLS